jgi:putative methyltransferase (TIGR04325 family)
VSKPKEYYTTWQSAEKVCKRYDDADVVKTFTDAALAIGNGDGVYDRDGKVHASFSENAHLIAALRHVSNTQGQLQVLDFGGALGSMYRQHRWSLDKFSNFTWCVVDQERFVETGRRLFTSNKLKFEPTIPQAVATYQPNIAVMSNILQRIENPFDVLNEMAKSNITYLFIDRTPVITASNNRITRVTLPALKEEGCFPTWHFSEAEFKQALQSKYRIINEFNSDSKEENVRHVGFFCEKI